MPSGKTLALSHRQVWDVLNEIADPEIPVISLVELGVVRNVEVSPTCIVVEITPTYSGCPAMDQMERDIKEKIDHVFSQELVLKTVYQPAWTTDWIGAEALEKLEKYGIAPPIKGSQDKGVLFENQKKVPCPRCASTHTHLVSQFGSTSCKALYTCKDCLEPFEYFKCI